VRPPGRYGAAMGCDEIVDLAVLRCVREQIPFRRTTRTGDEARRSNRVRLLREPIGTKRHQAARTAAWCDCTG
jgi:hypothetical protein